MVNLNLLPPWMKSNVKGFQRELTAHGAGSLVLSTRRSALEQAQICAKKPPGFPCAKPGCSQHQFGFAADISTTVWYDSLLDAPCQLGCYPILIHRGLREFRECQQKCTDVQVGRVTDLASKWYLRRPFVNSDPNHYQAYPTGEFVRWLRAWGRAC